MNIVFLGSPGAGKGTQALRLASDEGFTHISTGDIFRAELKNNTALGQKAKEYMDSGKLVPDDLVVDMVDKRISQITNLRGCILDGFPRNLAQAKAMEGKIPVELVVYIHVDENVVVGRLSGRRTCKLCGNLQSASDGESCIKCGGEIFQRDDDKEEVIKNRLEIYEEETKPLIDYYQNKGLLVTIDGGKSVDTVYESIITLVKKHD